MSEDDSIPLEEEYTVFAPNCWVCQAIVQIPVTILADVQTPVCKDCWNELHPADRLQFGMQWLKHHQQPQSLENLIQVLTDALEGTPGIGGIGFPPSRN